MNLITSRFIYEEIYLTDGQIDRHQIDSMRFLYFHSETRNPNKTRLYILFLQRTKNAKHYHIKSSGFHHDVSLLQVNNLRNNWHVTRSPTIIVGVH